MFDFLAYFHLDILNRNYGESSVNIGGILYEWIVYALEK